MDANNHLTPAGELRMLQLETLEWMVKNTPEVRKQRAAKRAAARKGKS